MVNAVRERPLRTAAALLLAGFVLGLTPLAFAPAGPAAPLSDGGPIHPQAAVPGSSGFTVSPNPDDSGVSTTFDASGVCLALVGSCTYSYSGLPSGCSGSSGASFSCTPSTTGVFEVNVTATWGCPLCATNNGSVSFTVNAYPSVSSVTATPANLDVGQSTDLSVSVSGGSTPFAYSWSSLPAGCSSLDTNPLSCQPNGSGTFSILVSVHDAVGGHSSGSVALSVASRLSVALSASPSVRDLGGPVTFTATVSGGQSPYTEAYTGLPPGCSSADTASLSCTPTAQGTYSVNVTAGDSVGSQASATVALHVVGAPTASLTATPSTLDVGQKLALVASVVGGSGGERYAYTNLPTGCLSANVSTLVCTPTAAGTESVVVTITDSQGNTATASASVAVNPALTAKISANLTAGLAPLSVTFSASVSGGSTPYHYAWLFAKNASSNLTKPRFVFVSAGNYSVSLSVTDAAGSTITVYQVITVQPRSNLPTYTVSFFVNPSGCGPITLDSFLLRDGSTEPLPAATYPAIAPSCPGFAFTQWVPSGSLLVSQPAVASTNVTVQGTGSITAVLTAVLTHGSAPPGGFSFHSLSSWGPYLPLLGVAVLLLVVMAYYLHRRRTDRGPVGDGDGAVGPSAGVPSASRPVGPGASPSASGAPLFPVAPATAPPSTGADRGAPTAPAKAVQSPYVSSPPASRLSASLAAAPATRMAEAPPVRSPYASPSRTAAATVVRDPLASRSPIAPPTGPNGPAPNGAPASRGPRPGDTAPPNGAREWPPSRIWDISSTPNTPAKSSARRAPPDNP